MKIFFFIWLVLLGITSCKNMETRENNTTQDPYFESRLSMVEKQIRRRGVKDQRVLEAMRKVPRHKFVPEHLQNQAYQDEPLPIGEGQTISQPYIVAYMTEQLKLSGNERILEIGTGSGYQTAILAELCDSVFTIEIIPSLSQRARKVVQQLGYENVQFKVGDGYRGWPEKAPFDAIMVTAAPDHIPQPLIEQLKIGGRMIIPVGDFFQELILVKKIEKGILKEKKLPVRFVPMQGEAEKR